MRNLFDKFMHPIVDFVRDDLNQEMLGKVFCKKGLVLHTFIDGGLNDFFEGSVQGDKGGDYFSGRMGIQFFQESIGRSLDA